MLIHPPSTLLSWSSHLRIEATDEHTTTSKAGPARKPPDPTSQSFDAQTGKMGH